MFNTELNNLFSLRVMSKPMKVIDRCIARAKSLGMDEADFRKAMDASAGQFSNWKMKPTRDLPSSLHLKAAEVLGWSVDQVLGKEPKEVIDPLLAELNSLEADEQREIRETVALLIDQKKARRKKPKVARSSGN